MAYPFEFKECPTCAAKPGMPTLCDSCYHNRTVINTLNKRLFEAIKTSDEWQKHTIALLRVIERCQEGCD